MRKGIVLSTSPASTWSTDQQSARLSTSSRPTVYFPAVSGGYWLQSQANAQWALGGFVAPIQVPGESQSLPRVRQETQTLLHRCYYARGIASKISMGESP